MSDNGQVSLDMTTLSSSNDTVDSRTATDDSTSPFNGTKHAWKRRRHRPKYFNICGLSVCLIHFCGTVFVVIIIVSFLLKGGHMKAPCTSCWSGDKKQEAAFPDVVRTGTLWDRASDGDQQLRAASNVFLDVSVLANSSMEKLSWTEDFPEAVKSVDMTITENEDGQLGCLKVSIFGLYSFSSQITFKFNKTVQIEGNRFYHTACKRSARSNGCVILAKSMESVLRTDLREDWNWKKSFLTGKVLLSAGDEVCVAVGDLYLVYLSARDSYFGLIKES